MVRGLDRVHLHQGDGLDVSLARWTKAGRPDNVLFFVDGDHSETSVYRELSGVVALVARPVVLLHDAFYQSSQSGYNVGPYRAIERVLKEHPARFKRIDSGIGLPGMTLLYLAEPAL
jgi:cephalosporin hydroxylase